MSSKSDKELAFLQDLYVATDFGERFAELVDAHIKLPKKGRALYVAAGTGSHAMALQERAGEKLRLLCVDESKECLELARAKALAINEKTEFQLERPTALSISDEQFDLVLGNASLLRPDVLHQMLAEMVRVTMPGGAVAWWLPTTSSFGEFFSLYWEALINAGLENHGADVERLITKLPAVSDLERLAEGEALEDISSWTAVEEFDFDSAEQFLNSPLITDFLLPGWLSSLPEAARKKVMGELARLIDEERHSGPFALTLKATLLMGKKSLAQ